MIRVTDVLKPYLPEGLKYANQGHLDRGTGVHEACRDIALGEYTVIDPAYQGWIDSFSRWFDKMVDQVYETEFELTSEFDFTGHPDFLGRLKTGGAYLLDYKTGTAWDNYWKLQLGAYWGMLMDRERKANPPHPGQMIEPVEIAVLMLQADGSMARLRRIEEPPVDCYCEFLKVLSVHRFLGKEEG
jgi:hypothetical protein